MKKIHFIIIGSGWRAMYYVRVAKALPELFSIDAILCRNVEKAEQISKKHDIYTTTSVDECIRLNPDIVVVAVSKDSIPQVSMEWMKRGFTVLCETPAALDVNILKELWKMHENGYKLAVAEQYIYYPEIAAKLAFFKKGLLKEPYAINCSYAHEYHGASLIRTFLNENVTSKFTVTAKAYTFPTRETLSRYELFTDGRIADKKRCVTTIEFEDGKVAFYDFNSEQYRSTIRHNSLKIQSENGEILNDCVYYLDNDNMPISGNIQYDIKEIPTNSSNPNFKIIKEYNKISFNEEVLYAPKYANCGLGQDETAIATVLYNTYLYSKGEPDIDHLKPKKHSRHNNTYSEYEAGYPLREALTDSYMAILLSESVASGKTMESEKMPWM